MLRRITLTRSRVESLEPLIPAPTSPNGSRQFVSCSRTIFPGAIQWLTDCTFYHLTALLVPHSLPTLPHPHDHPSTGSTINLWQCELINCGDDRADDQFLHARYVFSPRDRVSRRTERVLPFDCSTGMALTVGILHWPNESTFRSRITWVLLPQRICASWQRSHLSQVPRPAVAIRL